MERKGGRKVTVVTVLAPKPPRASAGTVKAHRKGQARGGLAQIIPILQGSHLCLSGWLCLALPPSLRASTEVLPGPDVRAFAPRPTASSPRLAGSSASLGRTTLLACFSAPSPTFLPSSFKESVLCPGPLHCSLECERLCFQKGLSNVFPASLLIKYRK